MVWQEWQTPKDLQACGLLEASNTFIGGLHVRFPTTGKLQQMTTRDPPSGGGATVHGLGTSVPTATARLCLPLHAAVGFRTKALAVCPKL